MVTDIALVLAAYLLGSISSAIVVCRALRLPDPRTEGSKNPGATNVLRIGGKQAAALTLAGDSLKGLLPVLAAQALGAAPPILALTAAAAFMGHLYPVFFGFRGGKGVATLLGVLFGLHWLLGLAAVGTWLLVAGLFRYSSLAALVMTACLPAYAWFITASLPLAGALAGMGALLFWRHRGNIAKLWRGEEARIGAGKAARPD